VGDNPWPWLSVAEVQLSFVLCARCGSALAACAPEWRLYDSCLRAGSLKLGQQLLYIIKLSM
jgi:hypothetical protein